MTKCSIVLVFAVLALQFLSGSAQSVSGSVSVNASISNDCSRYLLINSNSTSYLFSTISGVLNAQALGPYIRLNEGPSCYWRTSTGAMSCSASFYLDADYVILLGSGTISSDNLFLVSANGAQQITGTVNVNTSLNTGNFRLPSPVTNFMSLVSQLNLPPSPISLPSGLFSDVVTNNSLSLYASTGNWSASANAFIGNTATNILLQAALQCVPGCGGGCGPREQCNVALDICEPSSSGSGSGSGSGPSPPGTTGASTGCTNCGTSTKVFSATEGCLASGVRAHSDSSCISLSFSAGSVCNIISS